MSAAFDGGLISSDGGLVLLREAERRLGLAETLAGCIRDRRNQAQVVHPLSAMLRFRMLAIACGYEDADDCDALRTDPLFKLASGRAPESGGALCSQPTMSRLENAPSRVEVARHDGRPGRSLLPLLPRSPRRHHAGYRRYLRCRARAPAAVALPRPLRHALLPPRSRLPCGKRQAGGGPPAPGQDAVGARGPHPAEASGPSYPPPLAAHPDRLPGETATTVAQRPWPGARRTASTTSSGLRAIARCTLLHTRWPTISRCAAPRPAQTGCAASPPSTTPLAPGAANAGSLPGSRRRPRGFDARYIVTSLKGDPRHLYEDIYCARGQAENLIKMHKGQLASDRTSCQSPLANQLRLVTDTVFEVSPAANVSVPFVAV